MKIRSVIGAMLLPACVLSAQGQITLVRDGKPQSRIVVNSDSPVDRRAADLLQDFVGRISDAKLPVVESKKLKKGDVVIGQGSTEGLTEDGFRLADGDGILYISSGGDKGTLNGVVQLLEDYLGVQYYAAVAEDESLQLIVYNHL